MTFLRSIKKGQKRFAKALLMLFAAFLIFGGPTYLIYILDKLDLPRLVILPIGLVAFVAGLILFTYLSKEDTKTETSS